ncbi:MAG: XRE family transcriptional regulator, partial [Actinophytocola sp.]|nr:XRE family transcriptional regulator [Actinophytocola sp.]
MPNERLRDALLKNGLTPSDVAERLRVDPKTA